jgi:hypothetical protein
VSLASKVWKIGTRYYINVAYESSIQRSLFTVELESLATGVGAQSIVAFLEAGDGGGKTAEPAHLSNVAALSATKVLTIWHGADYPGTPLNYNIRVFTLDWSKTITGQPFEFNSNAFFPGALKMHYDGSAVYEAGFLLQPEAPVLAQAATGSLTLLGTYSFITVFKFIDNSGRIWRSVPSPSASIVLTGSNAGVDVTVGNYRISMKDSQTNIGVIRTTGDLVMVEVYRTKTLESTYYKTGEVASSAVTDTNILNDKAADSTIATGELLYVTGGEVANTTSPMPNTCAVFRNRMFDICGDGTIRYTKEIKSGLAAMNGDGFIISPDRRDGDFLCAIAIDLSLVLLKRSAIYIMQGDGPAANGSGLYSNPYLLTAKEGATNSRALGETPDGIIFKSIKGMRMLSRSLDVLPIEGSEDYDSLTINGSVTLDDRPFVCFVTAEGRTLVYDWVFRTWYTWTGQQSVGCCKWKNTLMFLNTNGTVAKEVISQYNDNGSAVAMLLTTQWISIADNFGNSRLYKVELLGDMMASFTLSCTLGWDYGAVTSDAAKTMAVTTATIGPLEVRPNQRRAQTVQVSVTESSTTRGFVLQALGLEMLTKMGARKQLPANRLT